MKKNKSFIAILVFISLISVTAVFVKPVMGENYGIYEEIISTLKAEISEMENILIQNGLDVENMEWTKTVTSQRKDENTQTNTTESSVINQPITTSNPVSNIITKPDERSSVPYNLKCTRINRTYTFGDYNQEIKKVQEFLETLGYFSHPHITPYFGPVTEKALQKFQTARGIVSSGTAVTTGFGQLGPKTRKAIEDISCQNESIGSDM